MQLSEFDFYLPNELVATRPVVPRSESRLLSYKEGNISDLSFVDLPEQLLPGDLLVFNNTKVIPALITGYLENVSIPRENWRRFEFLLTKNLTLRIKNTPH